MLNQRHLTRRQERRAALLEELRRTPNLMRGTVYERQRKCGRRSCACVTGGLRHPGLQVNVTLGGKTRTRYVRQGARARVEGLVAAYHRLWQVVEELTAINLALLNAEPGGPLPR
jgi:Family of unknown function (DUF6788)